MALRERVAGDFGFLGRATMVRAPVEFSGALARMRSMAARMRSRSSWAGLMPKAPE
ncbi:hypothetical protein [Nonomuraea sp. KM88]|uniref:hypothetical protein n=1 Tax=Nonomuraea sp. KM88 TaxID=3457427 RepID=UPI003FCC4F88